MYIIYKYKIFKPNVWIKKISRTFRFIQVFLNFEYLFLTYMKIWQELT